MTTDEMDGSIHLTGRSEHVNRPKPRRWWYVSTMYTFLPPDLRSWHSLWSSGL
jgi:hypothetical protein